LVLERAHIRAAYVYILYVIKLPSEYFNIFSGDYKCCP